MTDAPTKRPWERRPEEPMRHYRRFSVYLKLGPERSVRKAAEVNKLHKKGQSGAWQYWQQVAYRWQWADRAKAFDVWQNEIRQTEQNRLAVEAAIAEAEENEKQRRLRIQEARAVRTAGASVISRFLTLVKAGELEQFGMLKTKDVTVEHNLGEDGKPDGTFVRKEIERKALTEFLTQAFRAVIEGAQAERLELGEATNRTETVLGDAALKQLAEVIREHIPADSWEAVLAELDAVLAGKRDNGKPD